MHDCIMAHPEHFDTDDDEAEEGDDAANNGDKEVCMHRQLKYISTALEAKLLRTCNVTCLHRLTRTLLWSCRIKPATRKRSEFVAHTGWERDDEIERERE